MGPDQIPLHWAKNWPERMPWTPWYKMPKKNEWSPCSPRGWIGLKLPEGWNFSKVEVGQFCIILPWISRGTSYDSVAAAVNLDDSGGDGAAVWVLIVLVSWYMESEEIFHRFQRLFKKWTEKNVKDTQMLSLVRETSPKMVEVWELELGSSSV